MLQARTQAEWPDPESPVVVRRPACYTGSMPKANPHADRFPLAAALLLALPLVAGAFVSTGWSWGWDHLHRVPAAWPLLLLVMAVVACVPAIARRLPAAWHAAGNALAGHALIIPLVAAAIALLVFVAFPIATRMYGDSQAILSHHDDGDLALHLKRTLSLGVATRGSAVALLHDVCERLSGLSYERCYQLLSALCGAVFVFAHLRLAATLPRLAGWSRAAIAWLGLTDGANQLFFGHVENYTVPRLCAALFLMMVVRSLMTPPSSQPRRAWVYAPLALAIVFHLQWLVLLPAGLLLWGRDLALERPRLRAWTGGRAAALGLTGAVVMIAAAYAVTGAWCYDYLYTGGLPEPRQILLPLGTGCVGLPYLRYTLLSMPHLLDLFGSLWSLSSPAALLVILVLWRAHRRTAGLLVPATAAVAALLHNFVLNPSIGLPFDWDLMAVVSPPLLYLAVLLLATAGRGSGEPAVASPPRAPAWLIPLLLLGLATTTLFAVNAGAGSVYGRVEDMAVWLHRSYYGNSHYRLSGNLSTIADPAAQDRERVRVLERLRARTYPDDREVAFLWEKLGRQRAERQEFAAALDAYRQALRVEPSRWSRLKEAGWLETEAGDEAAGLALLEDYLHHAPDDAEAWRHLGLVQARAGRDAEARRAWERFLQLAPEGPGAAQVRQDLRLLEGATAR